MADAKVNVLPSTDAAAVGIDNDSVTTGAGAVYRQRVAVPDGADVAQGATGDASSANTVVGILKAIKAAVQGTLAVSMATNTPDVTDRAARLLGHVTVDSAPTTAVTGPLTDAQLRASAVPVSNASLPLPTGAATETTLAAANTNLGTDGAAPPAITGTGIRGWLRAIYEKLTGSIAVTGTFWQTTQPVSLATNTPDVTDRAARALGVVTASGTQARAAAITANPLLVGARATAYPSKPTSVAAGQLADLAADTEGVLLVRPRTLNTFVAQYRLALAAASSTLSFLTVANTDKQAATIYHAASATKTVRVRRVWVEVIGNSAAGEVQWELRRLSATTAPATGNPAITPINRNSGGAAVEATTLALPTTAGSETLSNSPLASRILNLGIVTAQTASPVLASTIILYDESSTDDEEEAPTMRAGIAEGYAVVLRSTVATTVKFIVKIVFTEE